MIRKGLYILLLIIALWGYAPHTSAHVLQTGRNIGVVMHVDPDDDPIAGEPTTFFFEIKDRTGKFAPQNWQCTARISRDGQQLTEQALFGGQGTTNIDTPLFDYVLPARGVYKIEVSGQPDQDGGFQPFSVKFDLRVERESKAAVNQPSAPNDDKDKTSHLHHYLIFGGGFIVLIFILMRDKRRLKKQAKKGHTRLSCLIAAALLVGLTMHMTDLAGALCAEQGHTISMQDGHACCGQDAVIFSTKTTVSPLLTNESLDIPEAQSPSQLSYITPNNRAPPSVS